MAEAWERTGRVISALALRGMHISSSSFSLVLEPPPIDKPDQRGETRTNRTRNEYGGLVARHITVSMQPGLPSIEFERVMAHELTHVWLAIAEVHPSKLLEEGLAEANAYWYLGQDERPLAAPLRHLIPLQADELYGGGFALVRNSEIRVGWDVILTSVRCTGQLPR